MSSEIYAIGHKFLQSKNQSNPAQALEPYFLSIGRNACFFHLRERLLNNDIFRIDYVSPYPLPEETVSQSGYSQREKIEADIKDASFGTSVRDIIVLVAPEGYGKSSALHYTVGYRFPREFADVFAAMRFIVFNTKDWSAILSAAEMREKITSELEARVLGKKFRDVRQAYEQRRLTLVSEGEEIPPLAQQSTRDRIVYLLAYCGLSLKDEPIDYRLAVVFDNMDTLSFQQQTDLFFQIRGLYDDITTAKSRLMRARAEDRRGQLLFIVPLRPETHKSLFANSSGPNWPQDGKYTLIDLTKKLDFNIWRLAQRRLDHTPSFASKEMKKAVSLLQLTPELAIKLAVDDPVDYVRALSKWLMEKHPVWAEQIHLFCGLSLRRELMCAAKVLGHPTMKYLFDAVRFDVSVDVEMKEIFWDVLYDFLQPLGDQDTFDARTFLVNPYKLVERSPKALKDAPLIGIRLFECLKGAQTDMIERKTIVSRLLSLAYEHRSIDEALSALEAARVLRPAGWLDHHPSRYIMDDVAIDKYMSLMTFQNVDESLVFVGNAVRHIFGWDVYCPVSWKLQRVYLRLMFFYEVWYAERRLRSLLLQKYNDDSDRVATLRVPSYVGMLGSKPINRLEFALNQLSKEIKGERLEAFRDACCKIVDTIGMSYRRSSPKFLSGHVY